MQDCDGLDNHSQQWLDFIQMLIRYVSSTVSEDAMEHLMAERCQLPVPIGETLMTYEECVLARGEAKGEARGEARGEAKKSQQIALNLLKEGAEEAFVGKVTGLSLEQVRELRVTRSD
ncbi:MAG: hypothetical protein EA349_13620 [Halomonadaceae bacterium]|nr:MAG: hypothetical protein EA349_13620 [Halomonadaceae bacterium]